MKYPLHINPDDRTDEANSVRYELHTRMWNLNPQGWPVPPGGKPPHRKKARKQPGVAVGRAAQLGAALAGDVKRVS